MYIKAIMIILFFLAIMSFTQTIAQEPVKDLSIGNKWFYKQTGWAHGGINLNASRTIEVIGDTVIDGIEYAKLLENYIGENGFTNFYRFFEMADSSKLRTVYFCYFYWGPNWVNELSYDFSMELGEIFYNDTINFYQPSFEIEYKGDTTLFNQQLNYIKINTWDCDYFSGDFDHFIIAEKFGMIQRNSDGSDAHETQILQGTIIDGVVYGDTNLVLKVDEVYVNYVFNLESNYPNPFNPNTSIKYKIPEITFVTIKVYDVLGNEVATLVNEEKPAGSYEIEFQSTMGSRQLASGIYYYQLMAGDYVGTKKMILLK